MSSNNNNNHSNPRSLAQDAAAWYFSHVDPYESNESNIQSYLRTPLVALTVQTLQPPPPPVVPVAPAAPVESTSTPQGGVEEHKEEAEDDDDVEEKKSPNNGTSSSNNNNNGSGGDWRDYLRSENVLDAKSVGTNGSEMPQRRRLHDEYASLSRRTRARMEAFLAGCSLAVPGEGEAEDRRRQQQQQQQQQLSKNEINSKTTGTVSLHDGLLGFTNGSGSSSNVGATTNGHRRQHSNTRRAPSLTETMSRSMIGDVTNPHNIQHPQIDEKDLVVRLELYIRTVQRVGNLHEECVVAMEPPKVIKTRARYVTNAFVATTSYVRNVSPVLTRLLSCLTMEMLAVECLADEISKVIHRVVLEYEHGTSFASLAFLSTPEVNADSLLTPLILKYLKYLQGDWERLVRECELERMLARALDPSMRKLFKTIEFRSIGHLLEVCHEYRPKLNNIELPPNVCAIAENISALCNSPEAIRQALRDLRRESIAVNGHVLPPVTSRKELIHLLTQTLNSRTLTAKGASSTGAKASFAKKRGSQRRRKTAEQPPASSNSASAAATGRRSKKVPPKSSTGEKSSKKAAAASAATAVAASVNTSDGGLDSSLREVSEQEGAISLSEYDSSSAMEDSVSDLTAGSGKKSAVGTAPVTNGRRRRSKFHLSTIDVLTRRLLVAASRTGNGGDAYFFVKDLFGGDEVDVVPSSTVAFQDRMVHPGTIDILVRMASVTIKCHQSFDIYPKDLVGECEPLIQFHTTTTESISLQEVRAADTTSDDAPLGGHTPDDRTVDDEKENPATSVMVVREQETDRTGWRTISIRAAMYERIETWNTPS